MNLGLIASAVVLILGAALMHFVADKAGDEKEKFFFVAVLFEILVQGYLVYEYVVLRGGFVVHNCIYGVAGALAFGAIILWASRMLFTFAHEGFRVMLGVSAIVAGCLAGCGIDLVIAFNSGAAIIESYTAALALCIGGIALAIGDLAIMVKNFSMSELKICRVIFDIATLVGVLALLYGAIVG